MSSIGARQAPGPEVGVATEDGKAYFSITSLLKQIRVAYVDVILGSPPNTSNILVGHSFDTARNLKLVITTRRERLRLSAGNIICIEDLGSDASIAKERIFSTLYPLKDGDLFVVGIDPGQRTGLAAFLNNREVESSVFMSIDEALSRVLKLIDNAPPIKKVVKIGTGMPQIADEIARRLEAHYRNGVKIQLVDERGTSSLSSRTREGEKTRDQRAAKLIAFREGHDYSGT